MGYPELKSLNQPWGASPFDPNTIGADVNMPFIGADGGVNFNSGSTYGNPSTVNQLQTLSGYKPWGSGLPVGAGFTTKLGSWVSGNGQMLGNIATAAAGAAQAYVGLKQLGMARDSFNFEKKAFKTNLRNSVQSYNTATQDRLNGRWYATEAERQAALKEAELSDSMNKKG